MPRRVAVTGLGLVSCLGNDMSTVRAALRAGQSGLRAMPEWAEYGLKSLVAGPIDGIVENKKQLGLPKKLLPGMSDAALFCCLAARDAVADSGIDDDLLHDPRTACIVASGTGSVDTVYKSGELFHSGRLRRIDPYTVLRSMSSSASAAVSSLLGIRGRSYSLSSACATSAHNIGHAFELIRAGAIDRAVAGGGEDVSELIAAAFGALRLALSTRYNDTPARASRPFDAARDGFVIGGGAGVLMLEALEDARRRGAHIRAEIMGYGANSDAFDLVLPDPEGVQTAECMRAALDDAWLEPSEIDYVNTHGTGTVHGDIAEVKALRNVFVDEARGVEVPPFSSTKSMTGHTIGAAGALELIFSIDMLEHGYLAPSINVDEVDPKFADLDIITEPRFTDVYTILSNNFGFGGTNASLVIQRASVSR